ncbi:transmembrane protein, putative (macronuclear) [Tetrahymena thermophila SB210]|uniref:Transmembrane protein, putative n=1 Tax=Tetrahymena thermophila (strain SB210) TaxID=312017 RepID=Q22M47_TETTS|nr:transmembrane protein, putative [Tetrahymena thermophila SB210]EAR86410.2 transmembrane protein, putative [Tetrahymena thermophila SB210]|eukprot:XP_977173.2 transmembrane protein, putative [Tetrahymena thermophila SB210]
MENKYQDYANKYYKVLSQKTFLDPIITPIIFYPLMGISSYKLFKLFKKQQIVSGFKKLVKNAIPIQQNLENTIQNQLIYIQGQLLARNQILAKDNLFKISTNSLDQLGLYRKVEVFHNMSHYHKYKCGWQDLNTLENIHRFYNASSIRYNVSTNGKVFLEDQQLNTDLLIQLSQGNSVQQQIDVEKMKQLILEIQQKKEQHQCKTSKEKDSLEQASITQVAADNPLEKLIFQGKHIEISSEYIQIMQEKGKLSKGDIRISFHEIQKIATATALAVQGKNGLTQFQSEDQDQKIEYFINGNKISFGEYQFNIHRKTIALNMFELQNNPDQIYQFKFKFDKEILQNVLFISSCHFACLKAFSCSRLLISSSLVMFTLMYTSYDQFGQYLALIDRIKEDLEEIKLQNQDIKILEAKDYFNRILNKLV